MTHQIALDLFLILQFFIGAFRSLISGGERNLAFVSPHFLLGFSQRIIELLTGSFSSASINKHVSCYGETAHTSLSSLAWVLRSRLGKY